MELAELIQLSEAARRIAFTLSCLLYLFLLCVPLKAAQSVREEPRIVAFQSKPLEVISQGLIECLEGKNEKPFKNDLLTKYGIVVLALRPEQRAAPIGLLESCSGSKSEWLQLPVIRDRETYQVPTNEIIVKLKNDPNASPIQMQGQWHEFSVVQRPTRRDPNRFTISLDGPVAAKSKSIAEEISKSPKVEYAEVNFVVISYPAEQQTEP